MAHTHMYMYVYCVHVGTLLGDVGSSPPILTHFSTTHISGYTFDSSSVHAGRRFHVFLHTLTKKGPHFFRRVRSATSANSVKIQVLNPIKRTPLLRRNGSQGPHSFKAQRKHSSIVSVSLTISLCTAYNQPVPLQSPSTVSSRFIDRYGVCMRAYTGLL